jgi:hypothetical protein
MSPKLREIASQVHDNIEIALWAIILSLTLYFIVFIMPNASRTQTEMQRIRMLEIGAEDAAFCEKLDMKRGTNKYNQCILDIGPFRLNAEKRVLDLVY